MKESSSITISEIQLLRLKEKIPARSLIVDKDEANISAVRSSDFQIYFAQGLFDEIWSRAKNNLNQVVGGLLVGLPFENFDDPKKSYLFVGGVMNNIAETINSSTIQFSWYEQRAAIETAFSIYQGFYIVGWYFSQPGSGVFLSRQNLFIAQSFFTGFRNITLIIDPVQKEYGFFDNHENKRLKGFLSVSEIPPGVNLGREYNYHKYHGNQNIESKLMSLIVSSKYLNHWKDIGKYQDIEFNFGKTFISYARQDQERVETIYRRIQDQGYKPWMDVHDLKPGEDWLRAIYDAIEESKIFIAILSNNSVSRRGVLQKELKKALDQWEGMLPDDIYIIPIRIDDCPIPELLRHIQVLDWNNGKGESKLLEAIRIGLERRKGA